MGYSPNRSETPTSKLCAKEAAEMSSPNIHRKKLAKASEFLPSRRSGQANIREEINFRHQPDAAPDEVDDAIASEVESKTIYVIHSGLKSQDSIEKAPEQGTDIELIPTLEYRPKVNLEDNDDLTMVVSNENIHAEKPVPDSSDNNGKICANAGRV